MFKKLISRLKKNEKGSVAVIAAVAFMSVAAFTGLVIDLGKVYMRGSEMQNAADAAAYSVGPMLPINVTDTATQAAATAQIEEYIVKNGFDASKIQDITFTNTINGRYTAVRVEMQDDVSYSFGPIVGINGARVDKAAMVGLECVTACTDMVPLGTTVDQFNAALAANGAQNVIVKYGEGDGETGFFGALDLDGFQGGGANDFMTWLMYGYGGYIQIGDILPVETGNMDGPTQSAFTIRYNSCTHFPSDGGCTASHYVDSCPRVVYLIIFNMVDSHTIEVAGFAPFVLEGNSGGGEILASHIEININDGEGTTLTSDNIGYGLFKIRLME